MNVVLFVVILAVLILTHEFGHFVAARLFKMRVDEFGIGFPPRISGFKKWGTLFTINWIPLGGFVKIAGEDGDEVSQEKDQISVISDNGGDNVKDTFWTKPIWQRIVVLLAGVIMNFVFGWLLLSIVFSVGTPHKVLITEVIADSPASQAGFRASDIVEGFSAIEDFTAYIQAHINQDTEFRVRRGGETVVLHATPKNNEENKGALGVGLVSGGSDPQPFFTAIKSALYSAGQMFAMIYVMLFKLIGQLFGGADVFQYMSGPVGIFQVTADAAGIGWIYVLNIIALISINLAALNVFPFPALDGGRIVFLILEKIKRKPISNSVQQIVNGVGFALLIGLLIFVSIRDVVRLIH